MEIDKCIECDEPAIWMRHTQFAGGHPYCDHCAALEDDFDENDSTTGWELIMGSTSDYMFKLENKLDLLEAKYEIALAALTALGNMETSGGGPDSLMAFYAREALKKIKGVKK